jgi:hypothetical protein
VKEKVFCNKFSIHVTNGNEHDRKYRYCGLVLECWVRFLTLQKKKKKLGMMVHTHNPSYWGGRDWEDQCLISV